jgi:hypothetical protein
MKEGMMILSVKDVFEQSRTRKLKIKSLETGMGLLLGHTGKQQ